MSNTPSPKKDEVWEDGPDEDDDLGFKKWGVGLLVLGQRREGKYMFYIKKLMIENHI